MVILNPVMRTTLMAVACQAVVPAAQAAISLDRTRAIFNGADKSMTLNIANDNKQLPYLAQAWLENATQEKNYGGSSGRHAARTASGAGGRKVWCVWPPHRISENCHRTASHCFTSTCGKFRRRVKKANVLQIALQTKN